MTGASEGIGKGYATAVSMEWVNGLLTECVHESMRNDPDQYSSGSEWGYVCMRCIISAAGQTWTECSDHESISGETAESGGRN